MDSKLIGFMAVIGIVIIYMISLLFQIKYRTSEYGLDLVGGSKGSKMVELFESKPASPLYGMGPFSNIRFDSESRNHSLHTSALYVPAGNSAPLKVRISRQVTTSGPSVDGSPNSAKSMSMFKYNKCMPECCPGTYSCSGGCICQTDKQGKFINRRGNNRRPPSEY